ncbi:MAG: amidase family protein, partial [Actinomycetota bacterium]|nr:amidase family protein [Actinomycetota bacterium]
DRTVMIDGVQRPYTDLFTWIGPAGVAYLPATVVPVGMSSAGLPIGVQIVAPYLEDRTAMHFAKLVSELCGGCPRPAAAG